MERSAPTMFRVSLEIAGSEKANAFYSELLGVPGRAVGGGRVYFDCGSVILALVDVAAGGREPKPSPEYLYFAVPDLDAVHRRATGLGCLSREDVHGESAGAIGKRPWGERSFYAADPFGNHLCFVDEKTLFTGRQR